MAYIHVIQGPDKGRTYDLPEGEGVIGRVAGAVELIDGTVSRNHARLWSNHDAWMIEDLGSANGTFLNGVKLTKPAAMHRGDQVRCGSTLLVFGGGSASPRAAVDMDENGHLVDAAIVATVPSNEDSIIIPTPEAGAAAIGNLRILYDFIAEIGSIFNIDLLLQRTLDKIFEVFKGDRGFIMLMNRDGRLEMKVSRAGEGAAGQKAPVSRTIINEVVSKQVGVLSSNAMTDKRFTAGRSVHNFGIRSAICVPIKSPQQLLGVIHVDCGVSEHTYSTEQLRLLTAIGYQTGLAIQNVRLYESAVQSERLAAVGETTAMLSHHIKNILQALSAGIDLVEVGINKDDLAKAKESWPIVRRSLDRINQVTLNMLAFSKAREPLLANINVNHVLNECVELLTPKADERGVAMLTDLDDMPAIPADAAGLQHAFVNLLTNALEAVSDATGAITVSSRYDSMNRDIVVSVADNGPGIEPEAMERIFNPFYSSKGQKGTGLGLAVVQKIVKEHQGRIEVNSKPGQGATFTVILPALPHGSSEDTAGPAK